MLSAVEAREGLSILCVVNVLLGHGLNGMAAIVQLAARAMQAEQTDKSPEPMVTGHGFKFRKRL